MKKLSALFLASTLSALPLMASAGGTLDLSLSDTTARIAWDATQVSSGMHLNAAYMHGSEENAEGDLISAGLHVVDVRKSQSRLYMGIGGNVYVFSSDETTGGALGVGGFFRYGLPFNPDLAVSGYAYYAPPVVSFSEVENMFDADLRLQYSVIPWYWHDIV